MHRTRAWELAQDAQYVSRLGYEAYRDLLIRAGFSEKTVREASKRHGWNRLSAGEVL